MDLKNIEPQEPAEGISRMSAPGFYRIDCSCGCAEHTITMELEQDEGGEMTVNLWMQVTTPWWKERIRVNYDESRLGYAVKGLINGAINRVTIAWTALTKGYLEMEADVILSQQQAMTLAHLLQKAPRCTDGVGSQDRPRE